jgi:pyruvate kinase
MKSEKNFFRLIDGAFQPVSQEQITYKKVKIVATMGPACTDASILQKMIRNGMDVARLNFSHGSHDQHLRAMRLLRQIAKKENKNLGILQDIQGPKIRVGKFEEGQIDLKVGQSFIVTTEDCLGDQKRAECSYRNLHEEIQVGHRILLDDGIIFLVVEAVKGRDIYTRVVFGGVLKDNKGINLPDTRLKMSCLTPKDRKDLKFGLENGVDFIALSFISDASDVIAVRKLIQNQPRPPYLIAKIETQHAVDHIDEILKASDGIMIARGDLGVECPLEQVPGLQKRMIRAANKVGKFTITATQMLESMIKNPRPTRAEASDVANAVLDGTDAVMLSAETASGSFPSETVHTMSRIIARTENYADSFSDIQEHRLQEHRQSIPQAIVAAAVQSSNSLESSAIVAFTHTGSTARMISRLRPKPPIFAVSPFEWICRRLSIIWGVVPTTSKKKLKHPDEMPEISESVLKPRGFWRKSNPVILLSGTPVAQPGTVNLVKIHEVN